MKESKLRTGRTGRASEHSGGALGPSPTRSHATIVSGPCLSSRALGELPQAHDNQDDLLPEEGTQEVGLLLEDVLEGRGGACGSSL